MRRYILCGMYTRWLEVYLRDEGHVYYLTKIFVQMRLNYQAELRAEFLQRSQTSPKVQFNNACSVYDSIIWMHFYIHTVIPLMQAAYFSNITIYKVIYIYIMLYNIQQSFLIFRIKQQYYALFEINMAHSYGLLFPMIICSRDNNKCWQYICNAMYISAIVHKKM